ncbi:MAG: vitamin K epoxide reductase family protein [Phycisphaerae bacterium]
MFRLLLSPQFLRPVLLVMAALGFAISLLLWSMQAAPTGELAARWCAAGERINCVDVLSSRWARFSGMPTSAWGAVYFGFLGVWFLVIGLCNRPGRLWHLLPLLLNGVGLAVSVWLINVMASRLAMWCTWCVWAHAANGIMFVTSLLAWPWTGGAADAQPYPTRQRAISTLGIFFGGLLVLGALGLAQVQAATARVYRDRWLQATNNADYIIWRWRREHRATIPLRADDPAAGPDDAPHTAVVFTDFQCPHCRTLDTVLAEVLHRYATSLRIVYKHYPLNAACNERVEANQTGQHALACAAARAAEAVRQLAGPEAAARFHTLLFEHASELAERPYARLAEPLGIDAAALSKTMQTPETDRRIREDVQAAARIGVRGSGTVFVDGRRLEHWQIYSDADPRKMDGKLTLELWRRILGIESDAEAPGSSASSRPNQSR